ncbi:hypothetical protein [Candidatus Magnetomonas plexicatena]|uniref:hypothetical protein n=1 Tax=Candidatus Magnetomonas plexicatena TaxID=2552947 RepID=UPI001C78A0B1|nr:hypothetical protein E2O03_001740 [Nitrospirales bacterium LBB_01]
MEKKTVLFVDDEPDRVDIYVDELKFSGWNVIFENNLRNAENIIKARKNEINILILDVMMPIDPKILFEDTDWFGLRQETTFTGIAFYSYLLRNNLITNIPVLIFTNNPVDSIPEGVYDGVENFIDIRVKTNVLPHDLPEIINNLLEKYNKADKPNIIIDKMLHFFQSIKGLFK